MKLTNLGKTSSRIVSVVAATRNMVALELGFRHRDNVSRSLLQPESMEVDSEHKDSKVSG